MPVLKSVKQYKLLLDTHVLLWYLTRDKSLQLSFIQMLDNADENQILISPMSIWEIGMLVEKKRIILEMDVSTLFEKILAYPTVSFVPLTAEIAILSTRLPGEIHGDPVDRILIATSYITHSALVTCDTKILQYGKDHSISVYNPQKAVGSKKLK